MSTVLLINPNTSASVTTLMADVMRPLLGPDIALVARTARFGASYIAAEPAYAVAAHAVLDAWAAFVAEGGDCDAVVVGCFGDPGVAALRACAARPVMGLAEAALREAAAVGLHTIVTGGLAWKPMLARFARAEGLSQGLLDIHVVERSGVALMAQPDGGAGEMLGVLAHAARPPARTVIIGGAALGGLAQRVAAQVPLPLIDSVQAGARWARATVEAGRPRDTGVDPGDTSAKWTGVSGELTTVLTGGGA